MAEQIPAAGPALTLAQRVELLFDTVRRPNGRRYSLRQVAGAITTRYGIQVSHSAIGEVRSGAQDNPTLATLRGLACFFGVPTAYLTGDDEPVAGRLASLEALRDDPDLQPVLVRARGLSAQSLRLLAGVLVAMRRAEGLPDTDPDLS